MPPKYPTNSLKIPQELLNNSALNDAISRNLPQNYNFEVHKTIWRIHRMSARTVALQMPEGLLMFAVPLAELLKQFSISGVDDEGLKIIILGDVTYGACCVDDYTAQALGVDLLVHYGHSCLVPLDSMSVLYIFININIDLSHFVETVKANFEPPSYLALVSTIQFVTSLQTAKSLLQQSGFEVIVPQVSPLSPGEVLGCTAPVIPNNVNSLIFLGDGRFHMESILIANPFLSAYRYDPYCKSLTHETYDHKLMRRRRWKSIDAASRATVFGLILGTLGRQGSTNVVRHLQNRLQQLGKKHVVILLSEISPNKLALFQDTVDVWIQVACPRLSIDWGMEFLKPILTPYEAAVALKLATSFWSPDSVPFGDEKNGNDEEKVYPMDYYAYDSQGPWTPNHIENRPSFHKLKPGVKSKDLK